MRVEVERGGGGRLQGLRSEGLLTIDGRRALEVAGTQLFLTRDGYRTFRAHGRARRLELPRPIGASRARARPRVVGRRDPRNVVITEPTALGGGRVGAWLVVDVGHPYLFDHPLDHVPGNLQLEACRQAAVAAVARDHGLVADGLVAVGISVDFADFAELDVPTRVTAEVAQPRLDRERERAVVPVAVALTQGDATVATATVEVSA